MTSFEGRFGKDVASEKRTLRGSAKPFLKVMTGEGSISDRKSVV
jgi:hypothetical protein